MGDPRLLRVAKPVGDIGDPALTAVIADIYETMRPAPQEDFGAAVRVLTGWRRSPAAT